MDIEQNFSATLTSKIEKFLSSTDIQLKVQNAKYSIIDNCNFYQSFNQIGLISDITRDLKSKFKFAIIISIGGSLSSGRSYCCIKNYYASDFKIIYSDSFNQHNLDKIFTKDILKSAAILVISKSGNSVETLFQTDYAIKKYQDFFGKEYSLGDHFYFITNGDRLKFKANSLNAKIYNYPCLGGKFSAFSIASLLPASLIGIDIKKILEGAKKILDYPEQSIKAAIGQYLLINEGYSIQVISYYNELLKEFAIRQQQISAEIIAKNNKGNSCLVSNGIYDQHGLWQLFLSGPKDKYFSFITNKEDLQENNFNFSLGKMYQELNIARLKKLELPYRIISIDKIEEFNLGSLSMYFLFEMTLLAEMIGVSATEQKAIEQGKLFLSDIYYNNKK